MFWSLVTLAVVIVIFGIRIVSQWQIGVVFRLGKYDRQIKPGLNVIIPILEYVSYVDMRIRTMDVIPQEILTKDSVPVKIDAVVYYKIFDASKSIIAVEHFGMASTLLAQSKLRDVLGKYDLDMLHKPYYHSLFHHRNYGKPYTLQYYYLALQFLHSIRYLLFVS